MLIVFCVNCPAGGDFVAHFPTLNTIVIFQELIHEISFIYNLHDEQKLPFNFGTVMLVLTVGKNKRFGIATSN